MTFLNQFRPNIAIQQINPLRFTKILPCLGGHRLKKERAPTRPQVQINPLIERDGIAIAARLPIAGDAGLYLQTLLLASVISGNF